MIEDKKTRTQRCVLIFYSFILLNTSAKVSKESSSLLAVGEMFSFSKTSRSLSLSAIPPLETVFTSVFLRCAKQAFINLKNPFSSDTVIGGFSLILTIISTEEVLRLLK